MTVGTRKIVNIPDWMCKKLCNSNALIYVGKHFCEMNSYCDAIWGNTDTLLAHIDPDDHSGVDLQLIEEVESLMTKLVFDNFLTCEIVFDDEIADDDPIVSYIASQLGAFYSALRNSERWNGLRQENALANLSHLRRAYDPNQLAQYRTSTHVNLWLAGPSLDEVLLEAKAKDLWPSLNRGLNFVVDSALPALSASDARIDFYGSIDPAPWKRKMVEGSEGTLLAWSQTSPCIVGQAKSVTFALDSFGVAGSLSWTWHALRDYACDSAGQFLFQAAREFWPDSKIMIIGGDHVYLDGQHHCSGFDINDMATEFETIPCRDGKMRTTSAQLKFSAEHWLIIQAGLGTAFDCSERGCGIGTFFPFEEWVDLLEHYAEFRAGKVPGFRDVVFPTLPEVGENVPNSWLRSAILLDPVRYRMSREEKRFAQRSEDPKVRQKADEDHRLILSEIVNKHIPNIVKSFG